jgi:putative tryptophan/tyrosine transport system substrate-binding protein
MRRREFIAGLGSTAACPTVGLAQQSATPVIGFLASNSPDAFASTVAGFRGGLNETGYVDGRNVSIEYRWAENQFNRLPALATELVRLQVRVIAAVSGSDAAQVAKAATSTIPIVFNIGNDPVRTGLVASLNKPGGNITGVTALTREIQGKRLEILRKVVSDATLIATLVNPTSAIAKFNLLDLQTAARTIGQQLLVLETSSEGDLEAAFASLEQKRVGALFISASPFFFNLRSQLAALSVRHRIPAIFSDREYVAAGGLISYGTSYMDQARLVGIYTGRILKGEKPADLPVLQPTKFELLINLKTAKALGLTIPETLLAIADEVIQ